MATIQSPNTQVPDTEQNLNNQISNPDEIPSYPVDMEQTPGTEIVQQPNISIPEQTPINTTPTTEIYKPSIEVIHSSETPQMVETFTPEVKAGEAAMINPNIGTQGIQGRTGVTTQNLVSAIGGYYPVNTGLVSNPHSGLLAQTANHGDPKQATVWQAAILLKAYQTLLKILGIRG